MGIPARTGYNMEDILHLISSGTSIGTGAIAGALIIVKFIQGYFKEIAADLKSMNAKLDEVIRSHEITKIKTEMEIDNIKIKLFEIEKRLDKLK